MKKQLHGVALFAALVLWAAPSLAQTADEIIEKHLAAVGGRAALSKLTSRVATGSISLSTPVGELKGTLEVYNKAPNKSRTLIKVDAAALGGGQITNDQRFDGTAGYVVDSFKARGLANPYTPVFVLAGILGPLGLVLLLALAGRIQSLPVKGAPS